MGNTRIRYREKTGPGAWVDVDITSLPQDVTGLTEQVYEVDDFTGGAFTEVTPLSASASFDVTYIGGVSSSVPPASPTVLSLPIGAPSANRWAVASLHFMHAPNVNLLDQVTINGEPVVILAQSGGLAANAQDVSVVFVRSASKIATGTTASLSISYLTAPASDAAVRAEGYRLIGANAPTLVQADLRNASQTITLTPAAGDAVLVGVTSFNFGATPPNGSNFTGGVTFRATTEISTFDYATVADDLSVATGGTLNITTPSGRKAGIVLRETA